MVEDTQNTSLQPTGSAPSSNATGNPQQLVQGSLQPQSNSTLQPTSSQSVNSINQLDQGSASISLNSVSSTTTTTTATPTTTGSSHMLIYGLVAVICLGVLAWLVYGLLKPHSKNQ
jgi:cobalamin biosynthesis Mg chelatase CobN